MTPEKLPAMVPNPAKALSMLRMLIRIRRFEERIIEIYPTGDRGHSGAPADQARKPCARGRLLHA